MTSTSTPPPELGQEYPSPDEAAQIEEVVKLFAGLLERKYPPGTRPMRRDAHTKAHGLLKAEFTVLSDVPERARVGLFKTPGTYSAWIRYSNGFTSIVPDRNYDVRGMAIKIMGVEGEKVLDGEKSEKTQDFLLINHNVFFSPTSSDYVEFTRSYVKNESVVGYSINPSRWRQALTLFRAVGKRVENPLSTRFWSSVPYKLGAAAVKYSAKPCTELKQTVKWGSSPDYLREAMVAHLRDQEACFHFMVQFQSDPVKMPVEDASIEWSETESPFIPVARIRIPPQVFDTEAQNEYAEHLSFTPWHSLPEHRPLGGVNRTRKVVYERNSALRHTANGRPRREPTSFADFAAE